MLEQHEWNKVYAKNPVETMPWFSPELDPDLVEAMAAYGLSQGRFLDIGTGPGNHAALLAERGFTVTGVDIAQTAIDRAREAYPHVTFWVDDMTQSTLSKRIDQPFEVAFDRGCFHTIPADLRPQVVTTLASIIAPGGWFFLKCFRDGEPMTDGPHRFTVAELDALFERDFSRVALRETIYQSQLTPHPLAYFVSFQRQSP
jgi:SAM-dependent methyltransferase